MYFDLCEAYEKFQFSNGVLPEDYRELDDANKTELLVFADWLDSEHGRQSELAENLRLCIELMEHTKSDLEWSCEILETIILHSEEKDIPFEMLWEIGKDYDCFENIQEWIEDRYCGQWRTIEEYVENYWDDCGYETSEHFWHPSRYVDWEGMARDLVFSGDIVTFKYEGWIYIFNNY